VTIESALVQAKHKPWGSSHLLPWSHKPANGDPIGELWFARTDAAALESELLLQLLFTTEPLSIQVHPDDARARSIDLANGKTEAWYILSAVSEARVAVGLKHSLSPTELRSALVISSYFALERVDLPPSSIWTLASLGETWILVIEGHAQFGSTIVSIGQAVFLEADHAEIHAGAGGMKALLTYPGPNVNSGALCEWHPTVPEHPQLKTQEAQTWSL
jgi:hypothetical protein